MGELSKAVVDNEEERTVINSATDVTAHVPTIKNRTFNVNGVDFTMVAVEGGRFQMGSNDGYSDEKPLHDVTLDDYYIGETMVTLELWQAVMNETYNELTRDENVYSDSVINVYPAYNMSYEDCIKFIDRLNRLTGEEFKLPTEAQWEFAARGGLCSKKYRYSGSDDIGDVAWYCDNSGLKIHAVKGRKPNELGIHDMSGDLWEWCFDSFFDYSSFPQTNPEIDRGNSSLRVLRGGGWDSLEEYCSVTYRGNDYPNCCSKRYGLRLAL